MRRTESISINNSRNNRDGRYLSSIEFYFLYAQENWQHISTLTDNKDCLNNKFRAKNFDLCRTYLPRTSREAPTLLLRLRLPKLHLLRYLATFFSLPQIFKKSKIRG